MSNLTLILKDTIARAQAQQPVGSPCTDICRLNQESGYCEGCFRSKSEIKAWKTLDDQDKLRLFPLLAVRQEQNAETTAAIIAPR
jgi:predicted Fe-S protein YdhL (DUF1289 family)